MLVVSAEFGERCRAGNGVRHVIVAAVGMRDGVPANRACATLKPYDLALKAIIARQDDAATVQKREEIAEQSSGLRLCSRRGVTLISCTTASRHRLLPRLQSTIYSAFFLVVKQVPM